MLIVGTDQADELNGTPGDDEISGGRGNDTISGNGGNDFIYWRTGIRAADSDGGDSVNGGDGVDRFLVLASTAEISIDGYRYTHSYKLEADLGGYVSWKMDSVGTFSIIHGGTYTQESHVKVSLRSIETFSFHGAYGSSSQPDDTILVRDLRGTDLTGLLLFDLGPGRDTLNASAAYNVIVALGGSGDDSLTSGFADDELNGGSGDDTLDGGGGLNTLIGGSGNDQYYSQNRFDTIIELAGEGSDTVNTGVAYYILQANVENLNGGGANGFTGIGNALDNVIRGGNGQDYLIGGDGNDTFYGGAGPNTLQGGTGNDTYYVESAGDTVYELAGEGTDTIRTSLLTYTLRANVENLLPDSPAGGVVWTGNDGDNMIVGTSVRDELYGLGGNDILDSGFGGNNGSNLLVGGTGNDTYRIQTASDVIVEKAEEGTDTVEIRYITAYTLTAEVEDLLVLTNQNTTMVGNELNNHMTGNSGRDNLSGAAGNDWLEGGSGGDFLSGGSGNDILNGGAGGDEMSGGTGADRFVFANPQDQDLVHDFSRAEGDKVDVAQLLSAALYTGSDPFADGYLRIVALPASGQFEAYTRLQFDIDGTSGPNGFVDVAIFRGGTDVIAPQDFILV